VIAYNRGSVPEIMVDGVTGYVVDDSAGAIDAVKRLREIDREVCRRHFERHFSVERMAQEYVTIYKRLVRGEALPLTLDDGVPSWTDLVSPNTTT
jgi:glycosyltransferase involved in cell wall biosynthesis